MNPYESGAVIDMNMGHNSATPALIEADALRSKLFEIVTDVYDRSMQIDDAVIEIMDIAPSAAQDAPAYGASLASAAQPASIFALRTDPAKGESPWGGIYSVRADAERDAEAMRKATGRAWEVVPLAEVIVAASPSISGAAAPHDWRVSPAYGGEICANCGAVKGTRRGNAHCREVAAPTTTNAAPTPAVQQGDAEQREVDARHAAIYRWMLSHIADVLNIFDDWCTDEEAGTDELHDVLAARAAKEGA